MMKKGLIGAVTTLLGTTAGIVGTKVVMEKKVDEKKQLSDKHLRLYKMMNQWVKVKQEGISLSAYLEEQGLHRIAIYGMNYAGETLVEELRNSNIEIVYGIDKRAKKLFAEFPLVSMDDTLEEVDGIVVTAVSFFDEIKEELSTKVSCPIISLEDVIYDS